MAAHCLTRRREYAVVAYVPLPDCEGACQYCADQLLLRELDGD